MYENQGLLGSLATLTGLGLYYWMQSRHQKRKAAELMARPEAPLAEFLSKYLLNVDGEKVDRDAIHSAYFSWSFSQAKRPHLNFPAEFSRLCNETGIVTRGEGKHIYCLNLCLAKNIPRLT
jgi:hypothetical protein